MKNNEDLKIFLEVARWKSFAEAARRLDLPTTTVSRKIQSLEQELNIKLFSRNTRSVSLTEIGGKLLPKAESVIESIHELQSEADLTSDQPAGVIRLTAPIAILRVLTPVISGFSKRFPHIRLVLNSSNRCEDIIKNRFDFAFRVGPLKDSSQFAFAISPIRYAVVAKNEILQNTESISIPSQLELLPCIKNTIDGYTFPWLFKGKDGIFELNFRGHFEADDLSISAQLALSGLGRLTYLILSLRSS